MFKKHRYINKSWIISITPIILAIVLIIAAAPEVFAASSSKNAQAIDPGESAAEVTQKLQAQLEAIKNGTVPDTLDKNSLNYLMDNRWMMTRMVLHGIVPSGFDGAVVEMRNQTKIMAEINSLADSKLNAGGGNSGLGIGSDLTGIEEYNNKRVEDYAETVSQVYNELKDLPGFGSGNTIFDRTQSIGYLVLLIGIMARIVFAAYKVLTHQEVKAYETITVLVKAMVLLLVIANLRGMIVGGLDMSDAAASAISGGDPSGIMTAAQEMLTIRSNIAAISDGNSGAFLSIPSVRDIVGFLAYRIAAAVIYVLLILGDVMMAITSAVGPIVIGISTIPAFERYMGQWIRSFITFMFYGPLAVVYCILLVGIMAVGIDSSFLTFIVICIAYIIGATKVPSMSENMSGAALAGMAMGMAAMPALAAKAGLGVGGRIGAGAVTSKLGLSKLLGGGGTNAPSS